MDWAAWWAAHSEAVITLIVGAAIGAFVNWVFFRKAEKPKRLNWEVMSRNAIISADTEERGRLKVLYDGNPVNDPNIVIVRLGNTGKREILEADFPDPIRVDFGGASVLTIQDIDRSDPAVKARWSKDHANQSAVLLKPELLNRGEWIEMKFVTDGELKNPDIDIRFAGQSAPAADLRRRRRIKSGILMILITITWIVTTAIFWSYWVARLPDDRHAQVPTSLGLQGGVVLLTTILFAVAIGFVGRWSFRGGWRPRQKRSWSITFAITNMFCGGQLALAHNWITSQGLRLRARDEWYNFGLSRIAANHLDQRLARPSFRQSLPITIVIMF